MGAGSIMVPQGQTDKFMSKFVSGCIVAAALAFVTTATGVRAATPKVGVAAAVKNSVLRVVGANTQPLSVGSDVFTSERIRTGEASVAQILFLDKTTLTVGPRAEVTLDKFVYNPSTGAGQVVLNAAKGAFRFITGSQNPRNYTIRTPIGTVGVRGTIVDLIVGNPVVVILDQGQLTFTFKGVSYALNTPGTAYSFYADGTVQGPSTWDGTIVNTGGDAAFPLYGWYFQGEPLNNGLPDLNVGSIDQLNGIIQHSLTPPPAQPPPTNNNCCL
jgi:hypothetical protein